MFATYESVQHRRIIDARLFRLARRGARGPGRVGRAHCAAEAPEATLQTQRVIRSFQTEVRGFPAVRPGHTGGSRDGLFERLATHP